MPGGLSLDRLLSAGDLCVDRQEDGDARRSRRHHEGSQAAAAAAAVRQGLAAVSGQHPGCRHRRLVLLRGDRSLQVRHRPESGRWHLAGCRQRHHHARTRHRVRRWIGPWFCRHHRCRPDQRDRRQDRQGAAAEKSLYFHGRFNQRCAVCRPARRRRRPARLGNPPGAVWQGCLLADLRAGLCQPRRALIRRCPARRFQGQPEVQQGSHLRLRPGPWRSR